MTSETKLLLAAAVLMLVAAPLAVLVAGAARGGRIRDGRGLVAGGWRCTALSTLLYVLAFNLTFLIQELFLVIPKALTPGLRPTLFHNNHTWEGTSALANLFQGTGALATVSIGLFCLWLLGRSRTRSDEVRLLLYWMAFCGCFMALPQIVIGALSPGSDIGMAMNYFALGAAVRTGMALVALVLMPIIALQLRRPALELAAVPALIDGCRARMRFVFLVVTLPALLGTALVIPFRLPREWVEVLGVPVLVVLAGVPWIQAASWRVGKLQASGSGATRVRTLARVLAAVVGLLLVFQIVLRPGIRFY